MKASAFCFLSVALVGIVLQMKKTADVAKERDALHTAWAQERREKLRLLDHKCRLEREHEDLNQQIADVQIRLIQSRTMPFRSMAPSVLWETDDPPILAKPPYWFLEDKPDATEALWLLDGSRKVASPEVLPMPRCVIGVGDLVRHRHGNPKAPGYRVIAVDGEYAFVQDLGDPKSRISLLLISLEHKEGKQP